MNFKILISIGSIIVLTACHKDFLDIDSKDLTSQSQVDGFTSDPEQALQFLESIENAQIDRMKHDEIGEIAGNQAFNFMGDAYANRLGFNSTMDLFEYDARKADHRFNSNIWQSYYKTIYDLNSALTDIFPLVPDTESVVQTKARFRALRAHSYFRLAQTYQQTYTADPDAPGIPLYDGQDLNDRSRSTLKKAYDFIISDIEWAYNNIGDFTGSVQFLNKHSIAGIYARILVETGRDYQKAAELARVAQEGGSLMDRERYLEGMFDINTNPEVLWGGINEAGRVSPHLSSSYNPFYIFYPLNFSFVPRFLKLEIDVRLADTIPTSDWRKELVNENYRSYKFQYYPIEAFENAASFDRSYIPLYGQGDYSYMRVSEMYLLEAEALARAGDISEAAEVLANFVRTRDSLYTVEGDILDAIFLQRRIELWGEGFDLLDIKRFGKGILRDYPGSKHWRHTDAVTGEKKVWNYPAGSPRFVFQIPESEIEENSEIDISDQNPL